MTRTLHTYERSAIKVEVMARKARNYKFRPYSAKCIVESAVGLTSRHERYTDAVLYAHKVISKETKPCQ